MATKNTTAYAEIVKFDEQEDGTVIAYGKATDATLDSDEQICDPEWLKRAMPEWFKYGNIREQHSSIAAGVATEYEEKDGGHFITAHIVDANSAKKIKTGVLKGFSIGIRRPRVIKDNKALGGRIVDGEIVEISVVDRPANPACTLVVAKAVGGVMTRVEEYTEKGSPDQPRDDNGRFASGDGGSESGQGTSGNASGELSSMKDEAKELADNAKLFGQEYHRDGGNPQAASAMLNGAKHLEDAAKDLSRASASTMSAGMRLSRIESAQDNLSRAANLFEIASDYGMKEGGEAMESVQDLAMRVQFVAEDAAKSAGTDIAKGSPDQERDDHGRFSSGGGSSDTSEQSQTNGSPYGDWQDPNWGAIADSLDNHLSDAEQIVSMVEPNGSEPDDEYYNEATQLLSEGYASLQDAYNAQQYADVPYFLGQAVQSFQAAAGSLESMADDSNAESTTSLVNDIRGTIQGLNTGLGKSYRAHLLKGSPDQPRDDNGRFASGDGGGSSDSSSGGSVQAAEQADTHLSGLEEEFSRIANGSESKYTESQWENITSAQQYLEEARSAIDSAFDPEIFDLTESIDGALSAMYEAESNIGTVARSHEDEDRWQNIQDMARDVISVLEPYSDVAHLKFISRRARKYADTDIKKFDQGAFDTARRALATLIQVEAGEMADGSDETYSLSCLLQAVHSLMCWYEGEEEEGETMEMPEGIEMSNEPETVKAEDTICETCGEKDCKCSSKADEVPEGACKDCGEMKCKCAEGGYVATEKSADAELRDTIMEIVKSLLPTEVGEEDKTKAAESERIEVLEAELAQVKSLAAPNGPRRFGAVSSTSKEQLNKAKAQQYRAKADLTLDKALADGYRQMARDLETNSNPTKGDANNGN